MPGQIHPVVSALIVEGLRRVAPDALGDEAALEAMRRGASAEGVPLEPYRRVLAGALAFDGGRALLRAGAQLRHVRHPFLYVLLNSDSPALLIEKEARLARFLHSRHRVTIETTSKTGITLVHTSRAATAPEPAESLAACGQHIVLFEEIGCRGLRCRLPSSPGPDLWVYDDGAVQAPGGPEGCHRWQFEWASYVPVRRPIDGLDEALLDAQAYLELRDEPDVVAAVERIVRRDLARTWRVAEVADEARTSARSLQRALAAAGTKYSDLLDRVRNQEAARLLRGSTLSVTEIGYTCGFADTAHFSHSFRKRFGSTPSGFRRDG